MTCHWALDAYTARKATPLRFCLKSQCLFLTYFIYSYSVFCLLSLTNNHHHHHHQWSDFRILGLRINAGIWWPSVCVCVCVCALLIAVWLFCQLLFMDESFLFQKWSSGFDCVLQFDWLIVDKNVLVLFGFWVCFADFIIYLVRYLGIVEFVDWSMSKMLKFSGEFFCWFWILLLIII